ncbi:hypothetical protein ACL655_16900 [Klebsiella quasipneumoniae subsp. similipneumoniae]
MLQLLSSTQQVATAMVAIAGGQGGNPAYTPLVWLMQRRDLFQGVGQGRVGAMQFISPRRLLMPLMSECAGVQMIRHVPASMLSTGRQITTEDAAPDLPGARSWRSLAVLYPAT